MWKLRSRLRQLRSVDVCPSRLIRSLNRLREFFWNAYLRIYQFFVAEGPGNLAQRACAHASRTLAVRIGDPSGYPFDPRFPQLFPWPKEVGSVAGEQISERPNSGVPKPNFTSRVSFCSILKDGHVFPPQPSWSLRFKIVWLVSEMLLTCFVFLNVMYCKVSTFVEDVTQICHFPSIVSYNFTGITVNRTNS